VIHRQEIVNRMVALPFIVSRAANAVCLRANAACDSGALRQPLFPCHHTRSDRRVAGRARLYRSTRAPRSIRIRATRGTHISLSCRGIDLP
jgi:hypothetical protein